jgi:diacylglycerol kinase
MAAPHPTPTTPTPKDAPGQPDEAGRAHGRPIDPTVSGTEAQREHTAIVEAVEAEAERQGQPAPARATFVRSFGYAGSGLWYVVRTQRNMRVHLGIAAAAVLLGIALGLSAVEFAILFVTIATVTVTEMVNTVVEAVVDLATQEYHPLAKVAKDVAAGAVLLAAALAVVVGLFLFVPHLWPLALRLLGR